MLRSKGGYSLDSIKLALHFIKLYIKGVEVS